MEILKRKFRVFIVKNGRSVPIGSDVDFPSEESALTYLEKYELTADNEEKGEKRVYTILPFYINE